MFEKAQTHDTPIAKVSLSLECLTDPKPKWQQECVNWGKDLKEKYW